MKSVFSICKIFCLSFFVVCPFWSCSSYLDVNGNKVPKKVTILITGYNSSNWELTMVDEHGNPAGDFPASPGQHIRLKIADPGKHIKIDNIDQKPVNQNPAVFTKKPYDVPLSRSWKGNLKDKSTIQDSAVKDINGVINYIYKIVWETNGTQHTYDPRIQIRF